VPENKQIAAQAASDYAAAVKDKADKAGAACPEMWVIESTSIAKLGYIPRHDFALENNMLLTLEECLEKYPDKNVTFLSHNWSCGPKKSFIDDNEFSKARMIKGNDKYLKAAYKKDPPNLWWIDWACIDQTNAAPGAAMLPAYMKCCSGLLCYVNQVMTTETLPGEDPQVSKDLVKKYGKTQRYFTRAWCRMERVMFASMCSPRNWFFFRDGSDRGNAFLSHLDDPRKGNLTEPSDMLFIEKLTEAAIGFYNLNYPANFDSTNKYLESPWTSYVTPTLKFNADTGVSNTACAAWDMSQPHFFGTV